MKELNAVISPSPLRAAKVTPLPPVVHPTERILNALLIQMVSFYTDNYLNQKIILLVQCSRSQRLYVCLPVICDGAISYPVLPTLC